MTSPVLPRTNVIRYSHSWLVGSIAFFALVLFPATSFGATLTFSLAKEFSGGSSPSKPPTFIVEDIGANTVKITFSMKDLNGNNLQTNEFATEWDFNIKRASSGGVDGNVTFNYSSGQAATSISQSTMWPASGTGFKADGDGYFRVSFKFGTSGGAKLTGGETAVYTVSATGLDATDFNTLSVGGSNGGYATAAHIQGIGPPYCDKSGWVGDDSPDGGAGIQDIPVPPSLILFALGFGVPGFVAWKRRRKAALGTAQA
jgi:hypothetical protein